MPWRPERILAKGCKKSRFTRTHSWKAASRLSKNANRRRNVTNETASKRNSVDPLHEPRGSPIGGGSRPRPDGQDVFYEGGQRGTKGSDHAHAPICHDARLRKDRLWYLYYGHQIPSPSPSPTRPRHCVGE